MNFENTSFEILVRNQHILGVSESEFNVLLYQTHDLQVLYEFFKLKLAFIKNNVHSASNFSVDHILHQINKDNIDEVCRVLKLGFLIQSDETQYEGFLKFIRDKNLLNDEFFDYLLHQENFVYLKLLKLAVGSCDSKRKHLALKKTFGDFFIRLLFCESKFVTDFVIVHIFPLYLQNEGEDSKISKVILENALSKGNLSVLCGLWDYFLDKEHFLTSKGLWSFIQECLLKGHELKNALFLMKQSLILIQDRDSFGSSCDVIYWTLETKNDVTAALTNFLLLFDVSQETQLYLIEPSFHLLSKIQILDSSWLLCLYKVLLSHSLTSVRLYCIQFLIKSPWSEDWDLSKISRYIFNSLNVYSFVKTKEVWNALSHFFGNLNEKQFLVLLRESLNIQWVPSVSYKFYKTYFAEKRPIFIPIQILQDLKGNIEKIPHIHIRNACMQEIKSFIRNSLPLYSEFSVFIKMNFILYRDGYSPKDDEDLLDFSMYQSDIEDTIKAWCSLNETIPVETEIIFQLLTLPIFHSHLETLRDLLCLNSIKNPTLSSRVCLLLCRQGIQIDVENFIISQFNTPHPNNNEISPLLAFLHPHSARRLYTTCRGLKNSHHTAEIAYELISKYVTLSEDEEIELMETWEKLFISGERPFTTNMCSLFLDFVGSKIMSQEFQFKKKHDQLFPILETILEKCHPDALPIIANNLGILLYNNVYTEEIDNYINSILRAINDWRKGECFKSAIRNFISTFYRHARITDDDFTVGKILGVTWKLYEISCDFDHVAAHLSSSLYDVVSGTEQGNLRHVKKFLPIIVELLLRGNNLGNVQRAEYMVCQEIDDPENNPNLAKLSVRINMIRTIHFLLSKAGIARTFKTILVDEMASLLMRKYKIYFKKRYSENCEVHLQKLRILQALLLINQDVETQMDDLVQLLTDSLCQENHQASIKFFIQWLLIKLLDNDDESFSLIATKLNAASKVHKSTIIAFAPILYHLVLNKKEEFWMDAFKIMLPWTMGPHFNLRLYSQETLSRLFDAAKPKGFITLLQNFHLTVDSINMVLKNSERRLDIIDNFVYYDFQPDDHFHLGVIYYDIPKFTKVTHEEYENIFNIEAFKGFQHGRSFSFPNVQQNIVLPQEELPCDLVQKKLQVLKDKGENFGELIVVASLVDKIPNLGGLCRSCEVFHVKKLILKNKSCLLDPQFRNVSLSSENWMDIVEVKIEALPSFLLDMKENQGYAIVGAEQTSNSIKLNKFLFPKKSLLVLGNEKEGIPPNLLPLLDFCVEIPQYGVVRSLNVHVAASTFIYEYTKQQLPDVN